MPERKTLNEDLFYRGSSANLPRLHSCENKVPFWDFSQFAVTLSLSLESPLSPSFLDSYSLSISSLGCKALCMVISFLPSSTSRIASSILQWKIPGIYHLMRFLLCSFVSGCFLVIQRYSLLIFFFQLHFDGVRFQYSQVFVSLFFSEHSDLFLVC